MLICKSRKLKRTSDFGAITFVHMKCEGRKRWGASCCWNELKEWFDVPKDAKEIWISLHTRPAENRYLVTLNRKFESAVDMIACGQRVVVDPLRGAFPRSFRKRLQENDEVSCYVEVEYK